MTSFSLKDQLNLIRRGVEEIIPEDQLISKINTSITEKSQLQVKLGCDPSRPDLHVA